MLDTLGIVTSSVLMMFIVVRALRLDKQSPWFGFEGDTGRFPGWRETRGRARHLEDTARPR